MAASFFVVPQWQGSASARAMRVADGALAIRENLPASSTTTVEVPAGAGGDLGSDIRRLSSIVAVRDHLADALAASVGPAVVIGGDCGVELAAIAQVTAPDVAVLWFDAHPDLNTAESSPSGAFTGMVLRTLLGEGHELLVPQHPLSPSQVVLIGARELDDAEAEHVAAAGLRTLPCDADADAIVEAVAATGASRVYVHIDVDVLDPAELRGLGAPVPFGMTVAHLTTVLRAVLDRFPLAGAGVTEFGPASPAEVEDDLGAILRIIGALTR